MTRGFDRLRDLGHRDEPESPNRQQDRLELSVAPVSAVLVTRDPEMRHLRRTLTSLLAQVVPPAEIVIVDATPAGPPITNHATLAATMRNLETAGVTVVTVEAGIGNQRRIGLQTATQPDITHLDEDAVLTNPEHLVIALDWLDNPTIAAVGGPVDPIDPGLEAYIVSRLERLTSYVRCTHYLTHERTLCLGNSLEACFPNYDRGNDIHLRRHLQSVGRVIRDPELVCLKDLPTTRQRQARNGALLSAAAIAGPTQQSWLLPQSGTNL